MAWSLGGIIANCCGTNPDTLNHYLISRYQQTWQPDVVGRIQLCLVQTLSLSLLVLSFFLSDMKIVTPASQCC